MACDTASPFEGDQPEITAEHAEQPREVIAERWVAGADVPAVGVDGLETAGRGFHQGEDRNRTRQQ